MVLIHKEIKKDVYKNIVLKNYNYVLIFWKLQSLDFKALNKHVARFLRIINNKKMVFILTLLHVTYFA